MNKIVLFDIEASHLKADFGHMYCVAYKELGGGKPSVISVRDFPLFKKDNTSDKEVVKAFLRVLHSASMIVGHYSRRFDLPFVVTRMLANKIDDYVPRLPHVDTWELAVRNLALSSNRLANISEFLDISKKTPLEKREWQRAAGGHVASIKYIERHCVQDVIVLEETYKKLRFLSRTHPNVSIMENGTTSGCPVCGNVKLWKDGWYYGRVTASQRYICPGCKASSMGKPARQVGEGVR